MNRLGNSNCRNEDILKDEIIGLSSAKASEVGVGQIELRLVHGVSTFIGTSENAVKSQIYIALTSYLLLQLISRTIAKKSHAFSNFVEKIGICLCFYLTLDYVCNTVGEGSKRIDGQQVMPMNKSPDLFTAQT